MDKDWILSRLRRMSERELNDMVELYRVKKNNEPKGEELFQLPPDVQKKLDRRYGKDENWVSYVEQLPRRLTLLPREGRELIEHARQVYVENCHAEDERYRILLKAAVEYASSYRVRPLLFVGPPGCGKSHVTRVFGEMVGLPTYHVDAPLITHGSGLSGESGSYQNASCGAVVSGMIRTGMCNYVMIVEEIDKVAHPNSQAPLDEQFLKFIDQDSAHFRDNRLGFDVDASHVIVLFTANDITKVSKPLIDRCEVVEFVPPVKEQISRVMKGFFVPKSMRALKCEDRVEFPEEAIDLVIDHVWECGERSYRQYQDLLSRCISIGNCRSIELGEHVTITVEDVKSLFVSYDRGRGRATGRIGFGA